MNCAIWMGRTKKWEARRILIMQFEWREEKRLQKKIRREENINCAIWMGRRIFEKYTLFNWYTSFLEISNR